MTPATPKPVWRQFIAAIEALGPDELTKRFARANQYLRDAGVYYRVYDNDERQRARLAAGAYAAAGRRDGMGTTSAPA